MTLTQLETFIKIVETDSFTSAANLLGYAQSTITTQIKQLEEELDCLLFERLGKTLVLTPEGERLTEYAQKMLQLEREILLEVPTAEEPSGILKVGVSESLCYNEFPRMLVEFKKQCPKVEIQMQFITHDIFPSLLKKGALDLVYTLNPYIDSPELTLLYKKKETLGFYACPDHPLADRENITEENLDGIPLLLTGHNCNFRMMLVNTLSQKHITPKIVLETSSKEILKQFAIDKLGVAFIPDSTARKEVEDYSLKRLDWHGSDFPIYSQVFIHKDRSISTVVEEFVKIIKTKFK